MYERLERSQEACASLAAADALYRAMGMTFWLPRTEAALARLGAPRELEKRE
jgi:hypothetical protein